MAKKKTKELKNQRTEEHKSRTAKVAEKLKNVSARVLRRRRVKYPLIAALVVVVVFLIVFASYSVIYAKTSYRNIYIDDSYFGGKNKNQIADILKKQSDEFLQSDIVLKYQPAESDSKEYRLKTADIGLVYDLNKTADDIYAVGRSGNILRSFYQQLKTLFLPYHVDAAYAINDEALNKKVADIAAEIDIPEKDFELKYSGDGVFELSTEKQEGRRINQEDIIRNVEIRISNIEMKEIAFKSEVFKPQITEENAKKTLADANKILAAGDLQLTYSAKIYPLDVDTIAGLIGSRPKKTELELFLVSDRVKKQVDAIASEVDRPADNAVLSLQGGKVVVSSESQKGLQLDRDQTKIDIENGLLRRINPGSSTIGLKKVTLKISVISPEIDSAKLTSYGLTELIASGTTNFAKSPANRIHNINVGVQAISGALVKPGETFSTLKRLGKVDASTGYLPELVIKNNKTVPDYGGGLCQVSTTLFRAALAAGVKISERQNHSYRVSYYEPPIGMDATIFDPSPDFKFVNNYLSYIFIQGKISGTKITFEFYGTKDSRKVEIGEPVGFGYVEPPAPIETPDNTLPAGERKLISKSHQGASAKFHYKVTRDGLTLQETDFLSKYVALPEIWLVGPPPVSEQAPAPPPAGGDPNATPPA